MKDISFRGIGLTGWFQKVKRDNLRKFSKIIFKILEVHGKKVKEILNKPNKNDDIVINENGAIICNQKLVSIKFNNYFADVPQNLLRELSGPDKKLQDYLKYPNSHSFFVKETPPAEVQNSLNNTRKVSDIYDISPEVVKHSSENIKNCLSRIFTASFREGIVPKTKMVC